MFRNSSQYLLRKYIRQHGSNNTTTAIRTLSSANPSSSAAAAAATTLYDMTKYFTHTTEEGFLRHSSFDPITVPNTTIDQYVWKDVAKWHDKIAIVCGETGRQFTYAQLRDHTAALAVRLQQPQFHLQPNDVIAICLPNTPEFPIATLGAIEAGFVITTVNPIYTADEIATQLSGSEAKLVIGTVEGFPVLQAAINKLKKPIKIVIIKTTKEQTIPSGSIDFQELIQSKGINFSDLRRNTSQPNDLAFLPYSSGTTGLSKGVMLSHNNITSNCEQINTNLPDTPLVEKTTANYQDVLPSVLPFFHIYGFTVLLASKLALGTKLVTLTKFLPDVFIKSLVVYKGTVVHLVPPIINFMTNHPAVEVKHLSSIRSIMTGAAPIGASDVERFIKKAGRPIDFLQGYGLTETSPVVLMNVKGTKNYGSAGGLTPSTEAKVVNLNDTEYKGLPPNESGELLVRGPQAMLGYFKNPEATAEMVVQNGWVRTGDIGYYDEQGYFYITDRLKELIKVKGFQVPPAELEAILRNHPKVADAAVVGAPHPISGEVPRAFVVKKEGVEVTEQELKEYVAEKVASFKRLEGGVQFLTSIPKNTTGKIMRRQIKEQYC